VKLDAGLTVDPARAGETAHDLEQAGYDGFWTAEIRHDPFLPLATAASATTRLELGTAIATAFTRSPMVTAVSAWDLQRASGGRFLLGLGTQVRAHNERRFSVPFPDAPARALRELVLALRHIWGAFQGEHPLSFQGERYRHDLMTPFFDPGPIDHPRIPVFLAAVTPTMYRVAGEVADGVHVHPFHTVRYLREVAVPALEAGRSRSGRGRGELELASSIFAVVGDAAERAEREAFARLQIAFYGSTRTYRAVFEAHGWGDLTPRLHRLMAQGDLEAMAGEISDDVLAEFAVYGDTWEQAVREVRERYEGLLDRVAFYGMCDGLGTEGEVAEIARCFRASAP
jgi:probable F420-dependent oxidoreductase